MSINPKQTPWLSYYKPNSKATVRLFCFPYLGGGIHVFRPWTIKLPRFIEVCAIQLPGRGSRLEEPSLSRMTTLVKTLSSIISGYLNKPFAFFGHSMGALVGFELARELRASYQVEPTHLFVSGSCAPDNLKKEKTIYNLDDSDFLREIRHLHEIPDETFEQPELVELVLPALRADFAIYQTYAYKSQARLGCPISAFGGRQDPGVSKSCLNGWRKQTTSDFSVEMFPGDHFFLTSSQSALLRSITRSLEKHDQSVTSTS